MYVDEDADVDLIIYIVDVDVDIYLDGMHVGEDANIDSLCIV